MKHFTYCCICIYFIMRLFVANFLLIINWMEKTLCVPTYHEIFWEKKIIINRKISFCWKEKCNRSEDKFSELVSRWKAFNSFHLKVFLKKFLFYLCDLLHVHVQLLNLLENGNLKFKRCFKTSNCFCSDLDFFWFYFYSKKIELFLVSIYFTVKSIVVSGVLLLGKVSLNQIVLFD